MGDLDNGAADSAETSELSKRISSVLRQRRLALGLGVEDVRSRLVHRIGVEHFRAVELGEESLLIDLFLELCEVYELRIDGVVEQATRPDPADDHGVEQFGGRAENGR